MKYEIYHIIGEDCMTADDGQKVYDLIHPQLLAYLPVEVDFTGVKVFASLFFNFAIGQLLKEFQEEDLNKLLKIYNLNPVGMQVLQRTIENSKRYYSNETIRQAIDEVISEQVTSL